MQILTRAKLPYHPSHQLLFFRTRAFIGGWFGPLPILRIFFRRTETWELYIFYLSTYIPDNNTFVDCRHQPKKHWYYISYQYMSDKRYLKGKE